MCVTASTAVVLFLLPGKVIKPCGDFSLQSYSMLYMISFFFFQLLFLQTELYRNLKVFNFLHPKYQLKKQTKNLFSGK